MALAMPLYRLRHPELKASLTPKLELILRAESRTPYMKNTAKHIPIDSGSDAPLDFKSLTKQPKSWSAVLLGSAQKACL